MASVHELLASRGLDDDALLRALVAAHPRAPVVLFERFQGHVARVLTRIFGADADVDDMTNDVFFRAIERIETLESGAGLRPWLTTIAVNVAREQMRARRRRSWLRFFATERPEPAAPAAPLDAAEAVRHLYAAIETMPSDERIAFALRFVEEMELAEVAVACGVSLATIKRTLARAEARFVAISRRDGALREWLEGGSRWPHR